MIRGGIEYNLGIFVTGVDKDSVAERAGLLVIIFLIFINNLVSLLFFFKKKKARAFFSMSNTDRRSNS